MLTNIFDTHAHYNDHAFDADRELLFGQLEGDGVCGVINIGADLEGSRQSVQYAREYPIFYATVGIHPEYAAEQPDDYIHQLRALAKEKKVVAIGEIGLDYHYEGYDKDKQTRLFEEQLLLAKELSLPVVIHSRDATEDCMALLKKHRPRGVMHCFSGSAETAREVQSLGLYISFTGVVTFKNAKKACEAVMAVAEDRLLLETDCPYMSPEPRRGSRCDSRMIEFTAAKIATLRGAPVQQIVDSARLSAYRLFGIGK